MSVLKEHVRELYLMKLIIGGIIINYVLLETAELGPAAFAARRKPRGGL